MIVNNKEANFEDKLSYAINRIGSVIGLPTKVSIFKKYLVCPESIDVTDGHRNIKFPDDIRTETLTIEETYLNSHEDTSVGPAASICVRKR